MLFDDSDYKGLLVWAADRFLDSELVITGPIGITLYLTWSIIQWIDRLIKPFIPSVYNPAGNCPDCRRLGSAV